MSQEAVIGRTAVRVWPDTRQFRKVLQAQLRKIAATTELKVKVTPDFKGFEKKVLAQVKATEKSINSAGGVNVAVKADMSDTSASIRRETEKLQDTLKLRVNIDDTDSVRAAIQRVKAEIRKVGETEISVGADRDSLDRFLSEAQDHISSTKMELNIDADDQSSIQRAVSRIDAELSKRREVLVSVEADDTSLAKMRAELQEKLRRAPVTVGVDFDEESSLRQAVTRINAELSKRREVDININVDENDLLELRAELESRLRGIEAEIKPDVDRLALSRAGQQLGALARTRFAQIVPIVANASSPAFRQLDDFVRRISQADVWSGLYKGFKSFLDVRTIAKFGAGMLTIAGAASTIVNMTGGMLNFGAALGSVFKAGLLGPGLLTGLATSLLTVKWALSDTNEQVPELSKNWENLQKAVSNNFWSNAREDMDNFAADFIPRLTRSWGRLGYAGGTAFAKSLRGFMSSWTEQSMDRMFDDIGGGLIEASRGSRDFSEAMRLLVEHGTSYLPRLGRAFTDMSDRFERWVRTMDETGQLDEWTEQGIVALKGLGDSLVGVFRILEGLQDASGIGTTMQDIGDSLNGLADTINRTDVQNRLRGVFTAIREGWNNLKGEAGPGLMELFMGLSDSVKYISPSTGSAAGNLLGGLGSLLGSAGVQAGLITFFNRLDSAAAKLAPTLMKFEGPLAIMLYSMGRLIDEVLPLFVDGIAEVFSVFDTPDGFLDTFINIMPLVIDTVKKLAVAAAELLNDPSVQAGIYALFDGLATGFSKIAEMLPEMAPYIGDILPKLGEIAATLGEAIAKLGPSFGEGLVGVIDLLQGIVEWAAGPGMPFLQALAENLDKILITLAGVKIAGWLLSVGGLIAGAWPLISGLAGLIGGAIAAVAAFLGLPVWAVVAIAAALAAAAVLIWKYRDEISSAFTSAMEAIAKAIGYVLDPIIKLIDTAIGKLAELLGMRDKWEKLKKDLTPSVGNAVGPSAPGDNLNAKDFIREIKSGKASYSKINETNQPAERVVVYQNVYNPQSEPGSTSAIRTADRYAWNR